MTLKEIDEIIREARMAGWSWLVRNAESYGMSPEEMFECWRRNGHMTPRDRFPYGASPTCAGEMPAAEGISLAPRNREVA